ncbi:MAG: hypothetical protein DRI75_12710 [Bacteroidetes bacterium]|nr:MAG: hypothetical protein DRI75_12710 [Bacteroidota bacterium]
MAEQLKINYSSAYLKYQILKGAWFVHKPAIESLMPSVNDFINGNIEIIEDEKELELSLPYLIKLTHQNNPSLSKNISVIPIEGSLMKKDYCGAPGMQTIGNRIKLADESDNVDGIILKIDSPGGTVDGTQELGDIVKNTSKPILAFADGLMASAAYWVGSSADMVMAKDNTTEVGSIGVVLSFMDNSEAAEKAGVKMHTVFADQSTEKWKEIEDAVKGDYSTLKEWTLNPLAEEFQNTVIENRSNVKDKALRGRVFLAKQAKKENLIDKIGNFESALKELNKLINNNIMSKDNNEKVVEMTISEDEKGFFDKLGSYFKPEVKDISDETKIEFEAKVSEQENLITELKTENEALKSELKEKDTVIGESNTINEIQIEEVKRLTEINDGIKTELTKKVAESSKIEVEDDKLEIGKLSEEDAAWANETAKFKEQF